MGRQNPGRLRGENTPCFITVGDTMKLPKLPAYENYKRPPGSTELGVWRVDPTEIRAKTAFVALVEGKQEIPPDLMEFMAAIVSKQVELYNFNHLPRPESCYEMVKQFTRDILKEAEIENWEGTQADLYREIASREGIKPESVKKRFLRKKAKAEKLAQDRGDSENNKE